MKWLFLFLSFALVGCGYKPSTTYTREVLGENIHVSVKISRKDPKNSVFIKDAVNEAVVGRFGSRLTDKKDADTNLLVSIESVSFSPTVYNKDGYVIAYKTRVTLSINYKTINGNSKNFSTVGEYDFPVEANSVISDTKRFDAIKFASADAINEIISKISIIGIMDDNNGSAAKKKNIKAHLQQ